MGKARHNRINGRLLGILHVEQWVEQDEMVKGCTRPKRQENQARGILKAEGDKELRGLWTGLHAKEKLKRLKPKNRPLDLK